MRLTARDRLACLHQRLPQNVPLVARDAYHIAHTLQRQGRRVLLGMRHLLVTWWRRRQTHDNLLMRRAHKHRWAVDCGRGGDGKGERGARQGGGCQLPASDRACCYFDGEKSQCVTRILRTNNTCMVLLELRTRSIILAYTCTSRGRRTRSAAALARPHPTAPPLIPVLPPPPVERGLAGGVGSDS